jgi:hypothetical protein
MGHEYMELKNTNAAIDCYRKAISKGFNRDAFFKTDLPMSVFLQNQATETTARGMAWAKRMKF